MLLLYAVYFVIMCLSFGDLGKKREIWVCQTVVSGVIASASLLASFFYGSAVAMIAAMIWGYLAYLNWNRAKRLS